MPKSHECEYQRFFEELIVMDRRFHSGRFSGWLSRNGNCKKEAELHETEETTDTRQIAEIFGTILFNLRLDCEIQLEHCILE